MSKEQAEVKPISEIYYIPKGFMVRLYTDGWHCTCHQPECEHIEAAKALRKETKKDKEDG
jgi:hypothetical protein